MKEYRDRENSRLERQDEGSHEIILAKAKQQLRLQVVLERCVDDIIYLCDVAWEMNDTCVQRYEGES